MSLQHDLIQYAYEHGYRVNEDGNVVSPAGKVRSVCAKRARRGEYLRFTIAYKGKRRSIIVHRLAAYQRHGEQALADGLEVRHVDGDRFNCRPTNLLMGTRKENEADKHRSAGGSSC